ncbi:MAG: translation elongation factor Ts [Alphaproteobacteria bacterium]|nr:translation elongation factor Ts [Alphaproteobacteria bacterium]
MAEITAALVKELREKTGVGMMDCKKALMENNGNVEESIDWLRKKGLSAAAKKAGRVAAEGLVAAHTEGTVGVVVEVNAETDFVARNEKFQEMVNTVAKISASKTMSVDELAAHAYPGEGGTVQGAITHLIAVIGENMALRRVKRLQVNHGVVTSYIHNATAPGLGKIGVLVALESTGDAEKLNDLGRKIAMHIAATQPQSLSTDDLDPTALERERTILVDQARASGRPEEIIEKMVEGRIRKFYEEVVLLEQAFVMDPSQRVKDIVEASAATLGTPVKLVAFERYALGEGIEKQESDFAAEVLAQAKA